VRQLDNDVPAVYEMLAGISANQLRQGNRLEEIATVVESHTATLNAHGEKLNTVDAKLDAILELLQQR
jgi:hypothetical protein